MVATVHSRNSSAPGQLRTSMRSAHARNLELRCDFDCVRAAVYTTVLMYPSATSIGP